MVDAARHPVHPAILSAFIRSLSSRPASGSMICGAMMPLRMFTRLKSF